MEPPKHDLWDADLPEKGVNKHIEKEFVDYIKQCIRNLSVKDDSTVIAVPEVSRFLPDDEDAQDDDNGGPEQSHEDKWKASQKSQRRLPTVRRCRSRKSPSRK